MELIKIEEEEKRNFYIKETINSRWSVRELQRQRDSLLYERLVLSQNKEKILELPLELPMGTEWSAEKYTTHISSFFENLY